MSAIPASTSSASGKSNFFIDGIVSFVKVSFCSAFAKALSAKYSSIKTADSSPPYFQEVLPCPGVILNVGITPVPNVLV